VATDYDGAEWMAQRDLMRVLTLAGLELIERFGWTRARVGAALDYELLELLMDSARDDNDFRNWYAQWRKGNPL
jgi:hypothetical protein